MSFTLYFEVHVHIQHFSSVVDAKAKTKMPQRKPEEEREEKE